MLNTKSLIKRKKITSVQSDNEYEERNIDENQKIIKNIETEVIKPSIFTMPKKQESEIMYVENDDIFR